MSAPTLPGTRGAASGPPVRRSLLRGLGWLVVRQHRTAVLCVLGLTLLCGAWIVYERHEMLQALASYRPGREGSAYSLQDSPRFGYLSALLNGLPFLLALFVGAPLIAADQENGTARLVTTQSVTRRQWLAAKLALAFGLALVPGVLLSALFTWWWRPYRSYFPSKWAEAPVFDITGPVMPALLLFFTVAGITIGVLVRRVLPAMVVTFVTAAVTLAAWNVLHLRTRLAPTRTATYPLEGELPARLAESYELDRWVGSADGQLYGWGSCAEATEQAQNACIKEKGIVDNVVEYLDFGQLGAMQWTAAGLLLAATALLTVFVLGWVSRRPL
ncbi:ABC transporter permease [Streptomyces sp. NPDC001941]|uniref:ABC transporter permease n=1 Tax=Streptomyces sp. NPDC001941 TaxID=3154659 RepID=UPI003316D073